MGQSVISWRKIKTLNRATGERFIHASTRDTNVWHAVRHDGSAAWVTVVRTKHAGCDYSIEPDPNPERWASCNALRTRTSEFRQDRISLEEWDLRAAELLLGRPLRRGEVDVLKWALSLTGRP